MNVRTQQTGFRSNRTGAAARTVLVVAPHLVVRLAVGARVVIALPHHLVEVRGAVRAWPLVVVEVAPAGARRDPNTGQTINRTSSGPSAACSPGYSARRRLVAGTRALASPRHTGKHTAARSRWARG
eukprot:2524136-Prymnesium_polylepis.1